MDEMLNMIPRVWGFKKKGILYEKIPIYKGNSHSYEKFGRVFRVNKILKKFHNLLYCEKTLKLTLIFFSSRFRIPGLREPYTTPLDLHTLRVFRLQNNVGTIQKQNISQIFFIS